MHYQKPGSRVLIGNAMIPDRLVLGVHNYAGTLCFSICSDPDVYSVYIVFGLRLQYVYSVYIVFGLCLGCVWLTLGCVWYAFGMRLVSV